MRKSFDTMSPAELIAETEFQSYGDYIDAQHHLMMWERPDAEERAMLVVPFTYCPNVSEILDDSNWESLQQGLAEADPTGDDYQVCSFSHWATPYKFLTVRPGSKAHAEAERCVAAMADYPVLDDEDFSEREYAAQCEAIEDALRPLTIEDDGAEVDSEQLAAAMFSDLWEHDQSALETHDGGCSVERDECAASLERLGYVLCEDDVWRPEGECEPATPDVWQSAD